MSKKNILIVDDSEFDRTLLAKALSLKGGFDTLQANSGEACLLMLQEKPVDLILLDIMMPGIHGPEVLTKIRESKNPIELPIIMVTSKSEASDLVECLKAGANDYVTKPLNFEIVVSRVTMHMDLAAVSKEMTRLRGVVALDMVIAAHHHSMNNSLATALSYLESADMSDETNREKVKDALWEIADSLKKISAGGDEKGMGIEAGFDPLKFASSSDNTF